MKQPDWRTNPKCYNAPFSTDHIMKPIKALVQHINRLCFVNTEFHFACTMQYHKAAFATT
jgi:hypothetical protein